MNWIVIVGGIITAVIGCFAQYAEYQKEKPVPVLHADPVARAYMPKYVMINNTWRVAVGEWDETNYPGKGTFIRVYGNIENIRAGQPEPDVIVPSPYTGEITGCGRELPYTLGGMPHKIVCGVDGHLCPACRHGHDGFTMWEKSVDND